jgi:hypothetical protein
MISLPPKNLPAIRRNGRKRTDQGERTTFSSPGRGST